MDSKTTLADTKASVQVFCEERDWDQFHGAKDLAIGLTTEAAELLQLFRFKSDEQIQQFLQDPKSRKKVEHELADSFFFILRFAQRFGIDLSEALVDKLQVNNARYPVETAKGSNRKYNER